MLLLGLCLKERSQAQMGSSPENQHLEAFLLQTGIYMGHPNTDRQNNCFMKKLVKNNTLARFIYNKKKIKHNFRK